MPKTISIKGSKGPTTPRGNVKSQPNFFSRVKTKAHSIGAKLGVASAPKIDKRHHIGASEWSKEGKWVWGKSSNVAGLSYDIDRKLLFCQFKNGSIYAAFNVEPSTAKSFFNSPSLGKWWWKNIRRKGVKVLKIVGG
jgi:KTSC domain-containing protein